MQYYKKGERVLLNGEKYTVKKVINGPNNTFFYSLINSSLTVSVGPVNQDRIKKLYQAATYKFCTKWKKAFSK